MDYKTTDFYPTITKSGDIQSKREIKSVIDHKY